MPELPEVETIARELRPLVVGATISEAWLDWPRVVKHPTAGLFLERMRDREILDVTRRGKWLVLPLSGESALAIQVKMTGQLFVLPAETPRDRHVHLLLRFADGRELRLRDVRKFGRVGLFDRDEAGLVLGADEATALFADMGPEPLDEGFTLRDFRRRLRARRGRLKSLLVDQSFLAGVGNIYADEALWLARLHPLRRANGLKPADERRLYEAVRAVLAEAVMRRGSSVDDYTAPEGDGEMQHHLRVYQHTGQPCLRCGRRIRRLVLGARSSHFCGWCQRLPIRERTEGDERLLAAARASARRGPRWSELPSGEGAVGARPGGRRRSGRTTRMPSRERATATG